MTIARRCRKEIHDQRHAAERGEWQIVSRRGFTSMINAVDTAYDLIMKMKMKKKKKEHEEDDEGEEEAEENQQQEDGACHLKIAGKMKKKAKIMKWRALKLYDKMQRDLEESFMDQCIKENAQQGKLRQGGEQPMQPMQIFVKTLSCNTILECRPFGYDLRGQG